MGRGSSTAVNPLLAALEEERRRNNPLLAALDDERARKEAEEKRKREEGPGIVDRAVDTLSRGVQGISRAFAPEDDDGAITSAAKATVRGLGSALATASPVASVGRAVGNVYDRAQSGEAAKDFAKDEGFLERVPDLMERGIASTVGGLATAAGGLTGSERLQDMGDTFRSTAQGGLAGEQTWDDLKGDFSFRKLGQFVTEQGIQSLPEMAMLLSGVGVGVAAASRTGNIADERAANNNREDVSAKDVLLSSGFGAASALLDKFGLDTIITPGAASALVRIAQSAGAEAGTEFLQGIIESAGGSLGTDKGVDWAAALDDGLAGAVAGAGMGGVIRGGIEAVDAGAKFRSRRANAPEQRGEIERAREQGSTLTESDRASPLPNDLIAQGKGSTAADLAAQTIDEKLEAAGLPRLKSTIEIVDTDGHAVRGTVEDTFEGGFKLKVGEAEGATLDYYLDDIQTNGDTLRVVEPHTAAEIDAEAQARAERAKASIEAAQRAAAEGAQRAAEGPSVVPDVPAPAPLPHASGATVTGEAAIAGFKARTRRAESGGSDSAKNPNSSATGRYQFTEGTFKQVYKQVFGGGDAAANAAWANSRNDAGIQERLMDRLTRDNAAGLAKAGIPVTEGNLYLAHFAGIGGATALYRNPNASAAEVLGQGVVNANPFLKGKTAGDVIAWAAGKMGGKAPAVGASGAETATQEDTWENPYTKALEEYRRQTEESGERERQPGIMGNNGEQGPIPDDPTRPDPASVYANQPNVTSDAEAGVPSPTAGIDGEPLQPGGDAAAPISDTSIFGTTNAGEKIDVRGEPIDREWRKFTPESGSLAIPRDEMPQIKAEHRGAMVNFLNARGVAHEELTVPASSLKPTQEEFSEAKVQKAREYEGGNRAILVSSDGHVLDGHHQWLAARDKGEDIRVIKLDAPVRELINTVRDMPSATTADGGDVPVVDRPVTTTPVADSETPGGDTQAPSKLDALIASKKQPPIVRFREEAAGVERGQPDVPEGHTRLWRAERKGDEGKGLNYTTDLAGIALPFREAYGGKLRYIDIPTSELPKYEMTGAAAPGAEFHLTPKLAGESEAALVSAYEIERDLAKRAAGATNPVTLSENVSAQQSAETSANTPALAQPREPIAARTAKRYTGNDETTAVTPTGREIPVAYRVVELGDLVASNTPEGAINPAYPAERQPRDRTRAASETQIANIAGDKFNPALLMRSPKAGDGSPIIDATGVVESGNGRTLALQRVYGEGGDKAAAYRKAIEAEGFDTQGMNAPVLVRVRGDIPETDVQAYVREANTSDTARMSGTEAAVSDAGALPAGLMDLYRGGDVDAAGNRDFVRGFVNALVPTNEQASMVLADGSIAGALVKRIEAAMLVRAVGNHPFIEKLVDAPDNNIKAIGKALIDVSGPLAQLREAVAKGQLDASLDISGNIAEAVSLVDRARREGKPLTDYVDQTDIFSGATVDPVTEAVLHNFFNGPRFTKPAGQARVAERLRYYIEQAEKAAPGGGLFGDAAAPQPGAILANARDKGQTADHEQDSLFTPGPARESDGGNGAGVQPEREGSGQRDRAGALQQPVAESGSEGRADSLAEKNRDGGELSSDRDVNAATAEAAATPPPSAAASADFHKSTAPGPLAPAPGAGSSLETQLQAKIDGDFAAARAEYERIDGDISGSSEGGRILNTDLARELSPEYRADRSRSAEVHEPASAFVKKLYEQKLGEPVPEGRDKLVLFTAGGTGAGKSTGMRLVETGDTAGIIFDTNMNGLDSAVEKIEQALTAGWPVEILYTYRDPIEALERGALPRAERMGRTVPLKAHIETHVGARKTVAELAQRYANNPLVRVRAVDNSHGKGNARVIPIEEIPLIDEVGLDETAEATVRAAYERGAIGESTFRGTLGERASAVRPASGQGSGRAGAADRGQSEPQRGGARPVKPAPEVSPNKAFTEDAYEAAKRRMAERKRRLNSGVDPEMLLDAVIMAGYHVEKGARTFAAYAKAFLADMEEAGWNRAEIIPHLRQFYENVRYDPRTPKDVVAGMSGPEDIGAALARLESEPDDGITQADADASAAQAPRGDDRASDDGSRPADAPRDAGSGDAGAGNQPAGRGGARDVRDDDGRGADGEQQAAPDAQSDGGRGGSDAAPGQRGGNRNRAGNRVRGKSADRGTDYLAPKGSLKRAGSWKATAERNLDIIELVNRLEAEGRAATPEEQKLLAQFTGWGASEIANGLLGNVARKSDGTRELRTHAWGDKTAWNPLIERAQKLLTGDMLETALQSTQYAHYTSEEVIRSIWDGVARLGFGGGRILEPGMGNGLFAVAAPADVMGGSSYTGIEMDAFTAKVASYLLPQENVLANDYTKTQLPDGFFDVAIGNPPFANIKILDDPAYKKHRFSLHDYFFAKTIDKVRPGGLMVFVTSRYTMDKQDAKARQYIADRADLLGAIRLPQTAFKENAGTEVVTDVLFFQRRAPGQDPGGEAWLGLKNVKAGTEKVMVNEYFAAHPKMVLGKHAMTGSMYRANEYTVEPMAMPIEKAFAKAIEKLPVGAYIDAPQVASEEAQAKAFERDFAPASEKEGGLYLKDGKLLVVESGSGVPLDVKPAEAAWLKDYVPLRDALKAAQKDQLQDGDWEKSHKALVKAYDAFAKKHGPILAFTTTERKTVDEDGEESVTVQYRYKNKKLLAYDVESPLVTQLERITDEGKIERGPFLAGRTLNKPTRRQVETVQDALAVTLDEVGRLDLDYIGKQLGRSRDEVIEDLGESIYETPDGTWQTEDEYLSGNVVEKLEEAEAAAKVDPRFERNVKALLARQPAPLPYSEINVKLGVGWIDPKYISQFADEVLGFRGVPVSYNATLGTWTAEGAKDRWRRNDTAEYGTSDRSPLELMEALLNNRTIKVTRTDSDKKTYTDPTATVAANEAAKKIGDRFKTWIWEDASRAGELADYYNRNFNNLAPRQFNGDHLTLPGLASKFAANTHPHVKRAVWRQIQTGNTYLAHAVGAGKTREMIIGGMEQKRLGLIKKPMYVVPNHMLEQFRAEFLEAYPAANLLVADEHAFHTDNRKRFMAQAALNDPDAIIVTHSSFGKIDTSDEARAGVVRELVGELEAAAQELGEDRSTMHTRKKIEKQIEQITRRFAGKTSGAKDKALTFEEMGVDFLYIDEAHEFRKLDFATNRTAKGIDPVGSQKALDLFIKVRWLEKQRPGRSVVLASGTPVTNTMAELFTVMRYMAKDQLDRDGIGSFDGWAAMFGEVAAGYEQNAAGGYEIVERFAKFVNVPELMKRVRTFMDVLTSDQLGDLVQRPKLNGGVPHSEVVPASEALDDYMKLVLDARLKKSRAWKPSKEQPGNPDPVINIISDARLSAIDMRFVRPGAKPDPNSKLNRMLAKIVERYKATRGAEYTSPSGGKDLRKGAVQIVFSAVGFGEAASKNRGFNLREWVDSQLVAGGIKKSEIAWMSDANTHAKKAQLQKDVRAGKVAVLIGSPKNMGTGLNVQKRLRDLHYLSPPWYPSDVEQPHGRIIRQGNENPEVDIWWYATKGTYDSTAWGMVSRKQKFIEQALTGDNSVRVLEDISESSQYEMAAALAAGDERIIQVAALSAEVDRLQRLEQAHANNQRQLRRNVRDLTKHEIPEAEAAVKRYEEAQKLKGTGYEPFAATIGGKTYDKPGEAGAALIDAATEATRGAVQVKRAEIGKLRDKFPLTIEPGRWGPDTFDVAVNIGPVQRAIAERLSTKDLLPFEGVDPVGMVRKADNALAGITGSLADMRKLLETKKAELAANEKRIGAPFAEAGVLAQTVAERAQLQAELAGETAAREAAKGGAGPAATPVASVPDTALLRVSDGEPATRRELKDLERDLNARLEKIAGKRVRLRITDRIGMAGTGSLNRAPDGLYHPSMKLIEVASDARQGATFVLDHEAVHALRDLGAFSPTDWMILTNAARKDAKLWAGIQQRYAGLSEEAQLEEAVADMFARFQDDADYFGPRAVGVLKILRKAVQILRAIGDALRGRGFTTRGSLEVMFDMRAGRTKADIGKYETGNAINKPAKASQPPILDLSSADPSWKGRAGERFDAFRKAMQDRYLPLLRTQEKIEAMTGRAVPESMNPYLGEELMSGRIGARLETLTDDHVRPLFDAMAEADISIEALESYLYARHARERNAQIAKINPELPDGGSGMTNTEARAILNRIANSDKADAMQALAARVDAIRDLSLDYRVETGLMSQEAADEWRATYQHYVPLRGRAEVEGDAASADRINRSGGGINVRGPESKRAYGRRSQADSPLAYLILQAEEAIVRGETNRVAQKFVNLAKANPDEEFWQVQKVSQRTRINEETGLVEQYVTNQLLAEDKDWTVSAKFGGKEVRVTMNRANPQARRLADSMKRLTEHQLDWVTEHLGKLNRFLSSVNTTYNPEFVIANAVRDMQTALINVQDVDTKGLAAKMAKHYGGALKAAMKGSHGNRSGDWGQWYTEFVNEGGRVYFNRVEDVGEIKKSIEKEFALAASKAGKGGGALLKAKRLFLKGRDAIENTNLGVENAVRLAAYRAARESGMSKAKAASIAKNLTVNFNRRGTFGPAMNAAYLFYNASIQGSVRMLSAVHKSKRVRRTLAGVMVAGLALELLNAMVSGDDDDGESYYDKIPEFEKQRNIIIMTGAGEGDYIKLPLPYGYNVFFGAGRAVGEVWRRGGKGWQDSAVSLFQTAADSFNPVGGAGSLLNILAPTAIDPAVDLTLNRDFTDRPIMPENNPFGPPEPDSQRAWPGVGPHWKAIAEFLGEATGGNDIEEGAIDVSPETLEYLSGVAFGAAGAFVDRVVSLPMKAAQGDLDSNDIPFARKVSGSKAQWVDKGLYYERTAEVEQAVDRGKKYRDAGDADEFNGYIERNRAIITMDGSTTTEGSRKWADKIMRQVRKDRRLNDKLLERGDIDAAAHQQNLDHLREVEDDTVLKFNTAWNTVVNNEARPSQ